MLPKKAVRLKIGELLAADATTFAPVADKNKIALIMEPFAQEETLDVADLVLATFTGSTPIEGTLGAQECGIDPVTGDQIITIKEPLGGYRWETTALTNLPQSIYGYVLLNEAGDDWIAIQTLPTPILLSEVGHVVNLGSCNVNIVAQPAS